MNFTAGYVDGLDKLCPRKNIEQKNKFILLFQISERADGVDGLKELASLSEYHIYTTLNAKNQFRAPTEWGLCLRPAGVDTDEDDPGLVCLACDSERTRGCWLTAMRLAKVIFLYFLRRFSNSSIHDYFLLQLQNIIYNLHLDINLCCKIV